MSHTKDGQPPRGRGKHARSDPEREAQEALSNATFQEAHAKLEGLTPEGDATFGFGIATKDARDAAPVPEVIEVPPDSQAVVVVTSQDAVAAYVPEVEPVKGVSPRMPTGKVKVPVRVASAEEARARRLVTQPSIVRGGGEAAEVETPREEGRARLRERGPAATIETATATVRGPERAGTTPTRAASAPGGAAMVVPAARVARSNGTGRSRRAAFVIAAALGMGGVVGLIVRAAGSNGRQAGTMSAIPEGVTRGDSSESATASSATNASGCPTASCGGAGSAGMTASAAAIPSTTTPSDAATSATAAAKPAPRTNEDPYADAGARAGTTATPSATPATTMTSAPSATTATSAPTMGPVQPPAVPASPSSAPSSSGTARKPYSGKPVF